MTFLMKPCYCVIIYVLQIYVLCSGLVAMISEVEVAVEAERESTVCEKQHDGRVDESLVRLIACLIYLKLDVGP
jgi:hypothetical protein